VSERSISFALLGTIADNCFVCSCKVLYIMEGHKWLKRCLSISTDNILHTVV
jgi:hypothetical protein